MSDVNQPEFLMGKSLLVPSAYDLDVSYHVVYGQFKWPSEQRHAVGVFLQRGETADFREALEKGEVTLQPALVLEEDLDAVMEAVRVLRES